MAKATLYNEDCLQVLQRLQSKSVDLILTDPPYNLSNFMKERDTNLKAMRENFFGAAGWDDLSAVEWERSMDAFFREAARVVKPGGAVLVFMAIIKVETVIRIARLYGLYYKTTGIWHKINPMPRNMNLHFINSTEAWVYFVNQKKTGTFNNEGRALHDFIEGGVAPPRERKHGKHPTQKPEKLMEFFIRVLSREGETVLDPFMGSGSTGVAAGRLGRDFIGVEYDAGYYETARKRIKKP
jgi:DNA modification methylase